MVTIAVEGGDAAADKMLPTTRISMCERWALDALGSAEEQHFREFLRREIAPRLGREYMAEVQ